jgi:membrane protein implicated in regulation of membrane protease activity
VQQANEPEQGKIKEAIERLKEKPNEVVKGNKAIAFLEKQKANIYVYIFSVAATVAGIFLSPLMALPIVSIILATVGTSLVSYRDYRTTRNALDREKNKTDRLEKILNSGKEVQNLEQNKTQDRPQDVSDKPVKPDEESKQPLVSRSATVVSALFFAATIALAFVPGINIALFSAIFAISITTTRYFIKNVMQSNLHEKSSYNATLTEKVAELEGNKSVVHSKEIDSAPDIDKSKEQLVNQDKTAVPDVHKKAEALIPPPLLSQMQGKIQQLSPNPKKETGKAFNLDRSTSWVEKVRPSANNLQSRDVNGNAGSRNH